MENYGVNATIHLSIPVQIPDVLLCNTSGIFRVCVCVCERE